jgi:hypothetical protein
MSDKIEAIIEKLFDIGEAEWRGPRGSTMDKIAARTAGNPERKEEKKETYNDWLKKQPKSKAIGIHKAKKK